MMQVLLIALVFGVSFGQDEGQRCGPFHGWGGCIPSEVDECCSARGYCSDVFNRQEACAQQALRIFYDGDKPLNSTNCNTDAECQRPGQPGEFFCSKEPQTFGLCGIKNVPLPFDGVNHLTFAPTTQPPTTAAAVVMTATAPPTTMSGGGGGQTATSSATGTVISIIGSIGAMVVIVNLL